MTKFESCNIPDVILVTPDIYSDNRGYFLESYNESIYQNNGIKDIFIQDNMSVSRKNTLRGLHFQKPPYGQSKLVRCVYGAIKDVFVDIREGSPTYGVWGSVKLDGLSKQSVYIPEGFAHGFLVLSDSAIVTYKVNRAYKPEFDSGIVWNDPTLKISWGVSDPILSKKDALLPYFKSK